jgi:hypothetical protein
MKPLRQAVVTAALLLSATTEDGLVESRGYIYITDKTRECMCLNILAPSVSDDWRGT